MFRRIILLIVAILFTGTVKTWLWYHVPTDLQPASWAVGGYLWVGGCALLLFGLPLLGKVADTVRGSLWNTAPGRWLIGRFAGFLVVAGQVGVVWTFVHAVSTADAAMGAACLAFIPVLMTLTRAKILIGRTTRKLRRTIRDWHMGRGGSAMLAGILDEWDSPWRPGQIMLGTSMFDRRWKVGIKDDRHFVTVATSRAGKGRDVIIPNLLTWPGSCLVIDPKGQNAAITAEARRKAGQKVYIIDPMRDMPGMESARFNPLAGLSPDLIDYHERVGLIAESIIVSSGSGSGAFFEGSGRAVISGLIDTVIRGRTDWFPASERSLGAIREIMIHPNGLPTAEMGKLGGMAGAAAALLNRASDKAGGDVFATMLEQTKWLDSPAICQTLSASDFRLEDLRDGNVTIYLVVPPHYLQLHSRFLRLFVNLALVAAGEGTKGKHPILFLFDEFYALGRLEMIEKAAGVIAGSGVKLWTILQNISQLQELFPKNWEVFLGNAGQWQVFAVNDKATAEYMSDLLGKRIIWKRVVDKDGKEEWEPSRLANLRDALEFRTSTSRESGRQMVFTEGGRTFLLNREHYDEMFDESEYAQDPYEKRRARRWSFTGIFGDWSAFKTWLLGEGK